MNNIALGIDTIKPTQPLGIDTIKPTQPLIIPMQFSFIRCIGI
jgi:hypothetical protein